MRKSKMIIVALVLGIAILGNATAFAASYQTKQRAKIAELAYTYGWAVDGKDIDAMLSIFSEDAVYDLSNLGFGTVEGQDALKEFMETVVFPGEPWSLSMISNIMVEFTSDNTATGKDYFIHEGFVPIEYSGTTKTKYSQFDPTTYYLLCNPTTLDKDRKIGHHQYKFVKENGEWKISWMMGLPLSTSESEEVTIDQIEQEMPSFFDTIKSSYCTD